MKLPSVNPSGVESFAAPPTGAIAARGQARMAESQAVGRLAQDIGNETTQFAELQLRRQEQNEDTSVKLQNTKYLKDNIDKDYYTADEIPDDIVVAGGRTKTVIDADGNTVEVPRRIPRAEVFPQMYERHMKGVIDAAANGISSGPRSDEFKKAQALALQQDTVKLQQLAHADMVNARRQEQDAQMQLMMEQKDFAGAAKIAGEFEGTDVERQAKQREVRINDELNTLNELKSTEAGTLTELRNIETHIDALRDIENVEMEMPDKARLQAANELEGVAAANVANRKSEDTRVQQSRIGDLEISIDKDHRSITAGMIDAEFARGYMSQEKRVQLHRKLISAQAAATGKAIDMERAYELMNNDHYVSPQDKNTQKALDWIAEDAIKKGENPVDVYKRIASKAGYIPQEARFTITAANNSYAPQMQEGLGLYNELANASPHALWSMPETQVDRLKTINAIMVSGGEDFASALATQRATELMTPAEREHIKNVTASKDFGDNNASALGKFIDNTPTMKPQGLTEFTPDIPPMMEAEFAIKVKQYLPLVRGDVNAAQARAFEDTKITWGLTKAPQLGVESGVTSDATYMKFPPQESPDVLKKELTAQHGDGEFLIMSDAVTELNYKNGEALTYTVYKIDPETETPMRMGKRYAGGDANIAAEKEKQVKVEQAREGSIEVINKRINRIRDNMFYGTVDSETGHKEIAALQSQIDAAKTAAKEGQ